MRNTRKSPGYLLLGLTLYFVFGCTAIAQEDPNSQYIIITSGAISSDPREVDVPVEVGVLRLQFSVQFSGTLNLSIVTPLGNQIALTEPNITVTETNLKRVISMWDPKPGRWKMRLSGSGNYTAAVTAQGDLYVCCIQFFGRNGNYLIDRFQPPRASRQQAQVYASGFNLEAIDFQLIDEYGEHISPVKFRQTDYSNPSGFTLSIDVPELPFRILARGRDTNGKVFQRVFFWLIRPNNIDPTNAQSENSPVMTIENPVLQAMNKDAIEGERKIVRAQVVKWSDEQLYSEKGNAIGIRLRYSIRFPIEGSYSPYPQLYPERVGIGFTGAMSMRVLKSSVEPLPADVNNPHQLAVGARAIFKPDIVYSFIFDLVPNYTIYNEQKKIFCLQTKPYSQQGMRDRFEREVRSEQRLRFRFAITGSDLDSRQPALTEKVYPPVVWYEGYKKEGAVDCQ